MVLSKALKAKLSLIPNGVASLLMPGLDRDGVERPPLLLRALVRPLAVAIAPMLAGPRWGPILDMMVCFARGLRCSLSWWRQVGLPLALWQESGPNFKGLPKVSGVATNHWVFLMCDWSPASS